MVSKLELFTISDNSIFDANYSVDGLTMNLTHPSQIDKPNEKWIDLKGDQSIYLKVTYDDIKKCRKPITDMNFYKISRFMQ